MKEKLHKFLHGRYGDTFTHLLIGAGLLFLVDTVFNYSTKDYLNVVTLLAGFVFILCGILYKELIYDKNKEKNGKGV